MEKIRCEICGGEICRQNGKYICVKCGCLYSADDLKTMFADSEPENRRELLQGDASHDDHNSGEESDNQKNQEKSSTVARKGRIWVIIAVVLILLVVSLGQIWLNMASGSTETGENDVRSVQEIIDSAAETKQPTETSSSD